MRRVLAVVMLGLSTCGEAAAPEPESPERIGPLVYEVGATWCTGDCPRFKLYRDDSMLQLLRFDRDDRVTDEVLATLLKDAETTVDTNLEALAQGQELGSIDPECLAWHDLPLVTLTLDRLTVSYSWHCPPSGLAAIDAIYADLITSLPDCTSVHAAGCESTSF